MAVRYASSALCLLALSLPLVSSCKSTGAGSTVQEANVTADDSGDGPRLCVAVRGNGNLIFAHFAGLARILEVYGLVDGTSGGSSGSITQFLYESVYANPALRQCDGGACSDAEAGIRAALLMKSLTGYAGSLLQTDEAMAFQQLQPLLAKFKAAGINAAQDLEKPENLKAFQTILNSRDIADVVSPELLIMLRTAPDQTHAAKEAYSAIANFGDWSVDSNIIFFRPGIVNFQGLARKLGRIASFYAGYAPADQAGMRGFLQACAETGKGKTWAEISALPAGGRTCGETFLGLVNDFRTKLLANEQAYPSRADDPVGKYLPMLVGDAFLEGKDTADAYAKARQSYLAGKTPAFAVNFDAVRFGYWGRSEDLAKVAGNQRGYRDLKTQKFLALGQDKWATVLSYSPAEPGLARLQEVSPTRISAGGWSDLQPVLVLKNLGCQNVVYLTRRGDESPFAMGVAKQLGMTSGQSQALYDLDADSSFKRSLQQADGVWCTDWNSFGTTEIAKIQADAYNAPLELHGAGLQPVAEPYGNAQPALGLRGCSAAR